MDLKLKFATLYKNFVVSKYRKTKQLIRLYTDYIDYIQEDYVKSTDKKIARFKAKKYAEYQRAYYDAADEKEIFNVVYAHKYEEYKKDYRMKFRVVREKLRREILALTAKNTKLTAQLENIKDVAKVDQIKAIIEQNNARIAEITTLIPSEEKRFEALVEEAAANLKTEFDRQVEAGLKRNAGVNIDEVKSAIETEIDEYAILARQICDQKITKKVNSINKKIDGLRAKEEVLKEKVDEIIKNLASLDLETSQATSDAKRAKLEKEIASYQEKLEAATTEEEKERLTKILNSLKGDLSLLALTAVVKEDLILDDEVLAVKDLCMYFGGIKAVNHLSFTVKEKEIFGLIGPNGAGKTTVFNCITQFYKPTAGQIVFKNKNNEIVDLTKEKVHNVILQGIVRTFQNLEVIKDITVLDNLLIAAHRDYTSGLFKHMVHSTIFRVEEKVITQRAIKVLEFMGLLKYKDMYAWGLPYGILKKIEIARTLMCNPQLIILDEPAAGLNDSETVELAALIRKIRDEYNSTILLVEHDMGLVMDVCDRICAISFGNLLALGTPKEIQQDKGVQEAYLGVSED